MKKYITFIIALLMVSSFARPALTRADDGNAPGDIRTEAQVTHVDHQEIVDQDGDKQLNQTLEVIIKSGVYKNKKISVENNNQSMSAGGHEYKTGDNVLLTVGKDENGNTTYTVSDYDRTNTLIWLFIFFFGITIFIGRGKGIVSFLGMGLSFLVIIYFILPQLLAGNDPFIIAIIASLIIIPLTFYLVHGFNKKTTAAVIGTLLTLIFIGVVSDIVINSGHLSGFSSEEAGYLDLEKPGAVNIKGLLLAGIIIGLLGILDDITISQASIVYKLNEVSPHLPWKTLYSKAMDVGRDHIASVVNTLILVYASAALPLLLLIIKDSSPLKYILNEEFMAEEIIRTLIASTGIVIAVPITTFLTTFLIKRVKK